MLVQKTQITANEVSEWIRAAARRSSYFNNAGEGSSASMVHRFSFGAVESELHRAHTKTYVRLAKPFRRLRRNQGAVNESLIRAMSELCNVNREMVHEIEWMRKALAETRQQIQQLRWSASADAGQAPPHLSAQSKNNELCE